MGNLIVSDEDYNSYISAMSAFSGAVEDRLSQYLSIMRNVRKTAILQGFAGTRLDEFIAATEAVMKDEVGTLAEATTECARNYLTEIDNSDSFLY